MKEKTGHNPKLFISYSWSSPEHETWVLNLATELRSSGVDVLFDKWDLKEGDDAYVYMEKMVSDKKIKKVLIICDKNYKEKADKRIKGVGSETQIISSELYGKQSQNKFVVATTEKDENGNLYLPVYYKSRIYFDFCDDNKYVENFKKVLRWIYEKPKNIKPEIGRKPAFLDDDNSISMNISLFN